jgi:hypothetical protein
MTKQRYYQAYKNNEPRYYLSMKTSRSFAKAFSVEQRVLNSGPFLSLSRLKRKVASLRKERAMIVDSNGNAKDCGPKYAWVKWRKEL